MIYLLIKLVHLLAVVMFLGNIITGLFWMHIAIKTKDLKIISHTIGGVIKSDKIFTVPGVIIITAGGILAALFAHVSILGTGWILWSIIMFSISGIAFGIKVAPLQRKIYDLTLNQENNKNFNWKEFHSVYHEWEIYGIIATVTPIIAFFMMVLKIPA